MKIEVIVNGEKGILWNSNAWWRRFI